MTTTKWMMAMLAAAALAVACGTVQQTEDPEKGVGGDSDLMDDFATDDNVDVTDDVETSGDSTDTDVGQSNSFDDTDNNPPAGSCETDSECDDGDDCTEDFCHRRRECVLVPMQVEGCDGSPDVACEDDADCAVESGNCQTMLCIVGSCRSQPVENGMPCTDGNACTDGDTCNGWGGCLSGAEITCGGNVCSDPDNGCGEEPPPTTDGGSDAGLIGEEEDASVDAGEPEVSTDGGDAGIDGGSPASDGGSVTDGGGADAGQPACTEGDSCNDGNACTTVDICVNGVCVGITPPNCTDSNPCTTDRCDAASGCTHESVADDTSCSDGNPCNGAETCGGGTCRSGTSIGNCVQCQGGQCGPAAIGCSGNSWIYLKNHCVDLGYCTSVQQSCTDGNACTNDSCDPATGCVAVSNGTCPDPNDRDGDGRPNVIDNCPDVSSAVQQDTDGDEVGDACDNCRLLRNLGQEDANTNSIGDACELVVESYELTSDSLVLTGNLSVPLKGGSVNAGDIVGVCVATWDGMGKPCIAFNGSTRHVVSLNNSRNFTPQVVLASGSIRWLDLDRSRAEVPILVMADDLNNSMGSKHNERP